MPKRFIAAGMPKKPTAPQGRKLSDREAAMAKDAQAKTAARGGNKKLSHKVYPHLD